MARKLEFDKQVALQKAMRLFWVKGYEATSLDDLVQAMEINRFSIYNTFGDKKTLLIKTLEYYQATVLSQLISPLKEEAPAKQCLVNYLDNMVKQLQTGAGRIGCLVQRTVQGNIVTDREVRHRLIAMTNDVRDALFDAIERGQKEGTIQETNAKVLAEFVMCQIQGMILLRQSGCESLTEQGTLLKNMLFKK